MSRELPVRPNLEHLKAQAKDLLDAYRRHDADALQRIRDTLPSARGQTQQELIAAELALHDMQSVIAREYGFASWAGLRARVESVAPTEQALQALIAQQLTTPLPQDIERAVLAAAGESATAVAYGSQLPIIPLRNALLPPGTVAPLQVGRQSTLRAVAAAAAGPSVLAIFSQQRETDDDPDASGLHQVGCAAHVTYAGAPDTGSQWIVVRCLTWIRLEALVQREPFLLGRISPFEVSVVSSERIDALERELRSSVRKVVATMPGSDALMNSIAGMTVRELADATLANLPCSVADKARYASEPDLAARLELVLSLLRT